MAIYECAPYNYFKKKKKIKSSFYKSTADGVDEFRNCEIECLYSFVIKKELIRFTCEHI